MGTFDTSRSYGRLKSRLGRKLAEQVADDDTTIPDDLTVSGDLAVTGTTALTGDVTLAEGTDIAAGTSTGTQIGTSASQKLGFFGATPIVVPTTTTGLGNAITSSGGAPGTPDYAIAITTSSPAGFSTIDEGRSLLQEIATLQANVSDIRTALINLGLMQND